ncbi:MAG: NAD(P)-binding domain-containing protein, partial [Bacteroidia bacterium]|nr:NAD(P)-binding domain-containing protein [Bacteroidia bacterium]
MNKRIAIIGGGNLGTAIAEGLLKSKFSKPSDIIVTKRNMTTLKSLKEKGVGISDDNTAAIKKSEVIILAVKPFQVEDVLNGIKKELTDRKLLISVVTGVTIGDMENSIKKNVPLFRAMPNTAIAIQESMTCICSQHAEPADIKYVNDL